jgi:hypothetical protein
VRYLRREQNLGPVRNYVLCATEQARGTFVWALGDDDLLVPGALQRVCDALTAHPDVQFFYANFAAANYQAHWPVSAVGGYRGEITHLACQHLHDRPVLHWQELLDSSSSMGTQVYVHIVARSIWTHYWHERFIAPDYQSVESTYPHSCMLIETAWDKPAYYLGIPHLVQFDGRPGWADGQGSRISLVSLPQLIARLDDRGLGLHALIKARRYLVDTVLAGFRSAVAGRAGPDASEIVALSLAMGERYPEIIDAMLTAIGETDGHVAPDVIDAVRNGLSDVQAREQPGGAR